MERGERVNHNINSVYKRTLNSSEFDHLLRRLDEDRERAGLKYEEVRRTLMRYFAVRKCFPEEDLADETLDRVARRLESAQIYNLSVFIWGVARIIVLELGRRPQEVSIETVQLLKCLKTEHAEQAIIRREERQRRLECFLKCLRDLSPTDRRILLEYQYHSRGRESKERLARRFNITPQGLRTRAHRVWRRVENKLCERAA